MCCVKEFTYTGIRRYGLLHLPSVRVLFPDFAQGSFDYSAEDDGRKVGEHSK